LNRNKFGRWNEVPPSYRGRQPFAVAAHTLPRTTQSK
jgi:hypothetical protein